VYLKDREKKAMAEHSNMEIGMEFHGLKNWNLFNRILYLVPRHLALFPFLHKVAEKEISIVLVGFGTRDIFVLACSSFSMEVKQHIQYC